MVLCWSGDPGTYGTMAPQIRIDPSPTANGLIVSLTSNDDINHSGW